MFCPKCGKELNDYDKFCGGCGTTISPSRTSYKLILTRPKNYVGCLISYDIYIDYVKVGKIKNGETIEFDISVGNHVISVNNANAVNINVTADVTADVVVYGAGNFGFANISGQQNNYEVNQMNENYKQKSVDKSNSTLLWSILIPIISIVLLFTIHYYVMSWVYGIYIGYAVVNLLGIKNLDIDEASKNKARIKNIIAIAICVVSIILTIAFIGL